MFVSVSVSVKNDIFTYGIYFVAVIVLLRSTQFSSPFFTLSFNDRCTFRHTICTMYDYILLHVCCCLHASSAGKCFCHWKCCLHWWQFVPVAASSAAAAAAYSNNCAIEAHTHTLTPTLNTIRNNHFQFILCRTFHAIEIKLFGNRIDMIFGRTREFGRLCCKCTAIQCMAMYMNVKCKCAMAMQC